MMLNNHPFKYFLSYLSNLIQSDYTVELDAIQPYTRREADYTLTSLSTDIVERSLMYGKLCRLKQKICTLCSAVQHSTTWQKVVDFRFKVAME